jgi:hypothetical protein
MASNLINILLTVNYAASYHDSVGSDKSTAKIKYVDKYEDWKSRCPRKNSEHPEYHGLFLKERDGKRIEGDLVEVELEYESNAGETSEVGENPRTKRYEIENVVSEEPLLTHPRYKDLEDKEKLALQMMINGTLEKPDGGLWENDIGAGERQQEAKQKVKQGITSYERPLIVWVERYSDNSLSSVDDAKVGYIDSPPGDPPTSTGKNYKYQGYTATQTDDGKYWNIERRWKQSDRGGWDVKLYTYQSGGGG